MLLNYPNRKSQRRCLFLLFSFLEKTLQYNKTHWHCVNRYHTEKEMFLLQPKVDELITKHLAFLFMHQSLQQFT